MRRNVDLLVVCVLALVAAELAYALDAGNMLRVLFALPLVLCLPGYALSAALFPERSFPRLERALVSLGLSIAPAIAIGFLLDFTPWGLTPAAWDVSLLGLTLYASVLALWRRSARPTVRQPYSARRPPALPDAREAGLFLVALLVALAAVALARYGALEQPSAGFTQLSMVSGPDQSIQINVSNAEAQTETYRLVLKTGNTNLHEWPALQLQPGQQWSAKVTLPPDPLPGLQALLYRADAPDQPYRQVSW